MKTKMDELNILQKVNKHVFNLFKNNKNNSLLFHDFRHTADVVAGVQEIGKATKLTDNEMEMLTIAAYYHDVGYFEVCQGHEEISAKIAEDFLKSENYPSSKIEVIKNCIRATEFKVEPTSLLEEVLCDADLLNVGTPEYSFRSGLLREEIEMVTKTPANEEKWINEELDFLLKHKFYTQYAQLNYNEGKAKNIIARKKDLTRFTKKQKEQKQKTNDKQKKQNKSNVPQRGVETMFRTAIKNHMQLSAMADSKANIMLSINALVLSIIISSLFSKFDKNPQLVFPTIFMLVVCLLTIVMATLSTRPKITGGKFTSADVKNKKANLLFFGNFHKMEIDEYEWGMKELMKDHDYLYGSMIRDLHSLGIVLNKKYRYLRLTYMIFMYGMIISVFLYAIFVAVG